MAPGASDAAEILIALSDWYPTLAVARARPAVRHALRGDRASVEQALLEEQQAEEILALKRWFTRRYPARR